VKYLICIGLYYDDGFLHGKHLVIPDHTTPIHLGQQISGISSD